jgi:lipopolysaccharide/colanic/teichoic acid biosynthesis glycosyltransferase
LWQVCRNNRGSGDFHQWIYYDLLYVKHASAQVDLKIILATIVTLGGKWCVPLKWIIPEEALRQSA